MDRNVQRTEIKRKNAPRRRPPGWRIWLRRILSLLILAALIAGIVWFVIWAVGWVGDIFRAEHQRATEATIPQATEVHPCGPTNLEISLTPEASTVPEGRPLSVVLEITSTATEPCSVDTGDVSVRLYSAEMSVWTPTACMESWDRPLLLTQGNPWSKVLKWNGQLYTDCEGDMYQPPAGEDGKLPKKVAATPPAGEYILVAKMVASEISVEELITIE